MGLEDNGRVKAKPEPLLIDSVPRVPCFQCSVSSLNAVLPVFKGGKNYLFFSFQKGVLVLS